MPRSSVPNITAAELRVLKALWRLKSANVRQIKDAMEAEGGEPLAYTTVMTLMNQLAAKDVLDVDRDRQPFLYTPRLRREQVMGDRVRQFLASVFDGQAGELVLHLVEEAGLTAEDLKRIEARIEERERIEDRERPAGEKSTPRGKRPAQEDAR